MGKCFTGEVGGEEGERDRSCWESLVKREQERGGESEGDGRSAGVHSWFLKAWKNFG